MLMQLTHIPEELVRVREKPAYFFQKRFFTFIDLKLLKSVLKKVSEMSSNN